MFCNNCGSKLPDGARFCNVCGAKVEAEAEKTTSYVDNMSFARDAAPKNVVTPRKVAEPQNSMSFDWSGVIDESHKRKTPTVQSPWGNTLTDEEQHAHVERIIPEPRQATRYTDGDIFEEVNKPKDPSRTMSFIDVLKAEREEKAQAAARMAEPMTERVAPAGDYSAFDNADGFAFENEILPRREREMTQGYTDMNLDIIKNIDSTTYEAPRRYATPIDEVDDIANSYLHDAPSFENAFSYDDDDDFDEPLPVREESTVTGSTVAEPVVAEPKRYATPIEPVEEAPVFERPVYTEPVYEKPVAEAPKAEEPKIEDLYVDEPAEQDLEAELAAILAGTTVASTGAVATAATPAAVEKPVAEAPVAPTVAEPVAETPAIEEPKEEESEIEALKRRLAELMGETNEEPTPVAKHETPDIEDLFADEPVAAPVEEVADFEKPGFVTPEAQAVSTTPDDGADIFAMFEDEAIEAAVSAPVQTVAGGTDALDAPQVELPETPEAPETDAMSIDDLEKDLFGDDFNADAEAEATKKIDKFYTLYKKNEEFQKLLDEEYNKLQGEDVEALLAQPEAVAQMSVPVAQETQQPAQQPVQQFAPQPTQQPVQQQPTQQPVQQQVQQFTAPVEEEEPLSKKELRAQKKAAKKAAKPVIDEDDEDEGGNVLTIIAVVIAVLLVILLGVILILNFAPDSGLGLKLDSLIQNMTSYFSALDGMNDEFLL